MYQKRTWHPLLYSGVHSFYSLLAFSFEICIVVSGQVTAESSFLWLLPAPALAFARILHSVLSFPSTAFLRPFSLLQTMSCRYHFSLHDPRNRKYCRLSCYHQLVYTWCILYSLANLNARLSTIAGGGHWTVCSL